MTIGLNAYSSTGNLSLSDLSSVQLDERHSEKKLRLLFSGTYFSVSNNDLGTQLSGMGAAFQALYTTSSDFAIGGGAGTAMGQSGSGAAMNLYWSFTYALTGGLTSYQSSYRINGKEVLSGKNSIAEGLRVQALFSQYYFNGTKSTIPYSGYGVQFYYNKFIKSFSKNMIAGVRIDQLVNNDVNLMPITMMFGIAF